MIEDYKCLFVSHSECGKTYFVKHVLENCEHVLNEELDNIVWIDTSEQPLYTELGKKNEKNNFVKKLPKSFEDKNLFPWDQHHLIILDDFIFQVSNPPEVVRILTQYRNHRNMSILMPLKNVSHQDKHSRTSHLNCNYLVLFKNL